MKSSSLNDGVSLTAPLGGSALACNVGRATGADSVELRCNQVAAAEPIRGRSPGEDVRDLRVCSKRANEAAWKGSPFRRPGGSSLQLPRSASHLCLFPPLHLVFASPSPPNDGICAQSDTRSSPTSPRCCLTRCAALRCSDKFSPAGGSQAVCCTPAARRQSAQPIEETHWQPPNARPFTQQQHHLPSAALAHNTTTAAAPGCGCSLCLFWHRRVLLSLLLPALLLPASRQRSLAPSQQRHQYHTRSLAPPPPSAGTAASPPRPGLHAPHLPCCTFERNI